MWTKDRIATLAAILIVLGLIALTAWSIISEATITTPLPLPIERKKPDEGGIPRPKKVIKRDLKPFLDRRRNRTTSADPWPTQIDEQAQKQAELEVLYMAQYDIRDHVSTTIGDFEGAGWAEHGETPPTCEPTADMVLIADAQACGKMGCYRVRAWKNP